MEPSEPLGTPVDVRTDYAPATFEEVIADLRGFADVMPDTYVGRLRTSLIPPVDGLVRVMVYDDNGVSLVIYGEPARVAFVPDAPDGSRRALDALEGYLASPLMGFLIERSRSSIAEMDRVVRRLYAERDTIPS